MGEAATPVPSRLALVDPEFCHLLIEVDGQQSRWWVTALSEFCSVVRCHGAWLDDISTFNQAQMDLLVRGRSGAFVMALAIYVLCAHCNGNGTLPIREPDGHVRGTTWCPQCKGTGREP